MRTLWAVLLLSAAPAQAQLTATGNAQITGQAGFGTALPDARLKVQTAAGDAYALRVSSPDGSAMFTLEKTGKAGLGVTAGAALDVLGAADGGNVGLQLRVGNSSSTTDSVQIAFAYDSTSTFRHSLRTRAVASQNLGNAVDFYVWRDTATPADLGTRRALSLQAISSVSTGSVHVLPAGTPDVELEVSNGTTTGGGTIHRAAAGTHSSRRLKSHIRMLEAEAQARAYQDVQALKHARFRYKGSSRLMRGLIYEDAPESVRGEHKTVVLDYRILNLELALKETYRRIRELEAELARREGR